MNIHANFVLVPITCNAVYKRLRMLCMLSTILLLHILVSLLTLVYATNVSLIVPQLYAKNPKIIAINLCAPVIDSFFRPGSFVCAFSIWALEVSFHTSYSPPQGWNPAC